MRVLILSHHLKQLRMDAIANNYSSIVIFLISGILGTVGQGIVIWIELSDLVYNKNSLNKRVIVGSYVSGSTFIGFLAGLAANVIQSFPNELSSVSAALSITMGFVFTDILECCKSYNRALR